VIGEGVLERARGAGNERDTNKGKGLVYLLRCSVYKETSIHTNITCCGA